MAEIHTYPEMNAKIKDLLRIGEQPICLYAAKRIEELEEYERKKGKWLQPGKCSECGGSAPFWSMASTYYESDFCPHCGADMRGET